MAEILFARIDDVDASAATTARLAAEAAQAAAALSASSASASATAASTDADDADAARVLAQAAAAAAAISADEFDDVYLGSKASDPVLDNDGNALVEGQLYWNSVDKALKVFGGVSWSAYNPSIGAATSNDYLVKTAAGDLSAERVVTDVSAAGGVVVNWATAGQAKFGLYISATGKMLYGTGANTFAEADLTAAGRAILDDADATAQRATLGLVLGTNVQAFDATLLSIAALGTAADKLAYTTGVDTWAETAFTAAGRALVDDADAATQRATLGLVIGTNVQAQDATLASIAALGTAADKMLYTTGVDTWAELAVTSVGRGLLDDTTTAAQLATLTARGQGKETIFIPASAMTSRSTNGAARGSVEQTTNKNMEVTLDFDTTTQEFAQFEVWFPKSWNLGTVTFQPKFSQLTTAAGGVVFGLAGVARSDGDAIDVAFGTAQTSTKTAGTANLQYIGPESAAITIAGTPAAGDSVQFQINRTVADGSDTLAQDARLEGVRVHFTTNAATDA